VLIVLLLLSFKLLLESGHRFGIGSSSTDSDTVGLELRRQLTAQLRGAQAYLIVLRNRLFELLEFFGLFVEGRLLLSDFGPTLLGLWGQRATWAFATDRTLRESRDPPDCISWVLALSRAFGSLPLSASTPSPPPL
jgi:hypothetical protein